MAVAQPAWQPVWRRGSLPLAVALISGAGLAFEIALTRIFSLTFQYHYAFLAVSLATLGLGAGAMLAARLRVTCSTAAGLLATAYPLAALLLARLPMGVPAPLRGAVALVPFALTGLFSARAFASAPPQSGYLYAADLGGAAAGVVASLALVSQVGAFGTVVCLGGAAALAGVALAADAAPKTQRPMRHAALGWWPCLPLLLNAGLLAFSLGQGWLDLPRAGSIQAPPDKTMYRVLTDPDQAAHIAFTAWDPFARIDVVETRDPGAKLVFTDGGAGSYMLRFDGDLAALAPLRESLEFLPFSAGPTARTLVLGAGAGKDVLLALLAGSGSVTAVEINPAMVAAVRHFAGYNGGILDRPEVRLEVGDARTFVERDRSAYDLVYLNLVYTQAVEPAGQALVESYVFTRQAFRAYLARLAPGGRLAIVSHNALEGSRAALTALAALAELGEPLPQATRHLALLMLPADEPTERQTVMMLGREPLSSAAVAALQRGADRLGMVPLFLPGVFEAPLTPLVQGEAIEKFVAADPSYDLRPVNDDRPFFFKLDPGLPEPIAQAAAGAVALSALLFLVAWRPAQRGRWAAGLASVALVGAGYMLLEVALIQRLQLLLGQPALATAVVLGGLLLGSGVGSGLSQRWPTQALGRRGLLALACGAALGVACEWLSPLLLKGILPAPLAARALAVGALATLLGMPLGIPFPSAMRLAGARDQGAAPLLWGVSGAFSALGSGLAVALAMAWGFGSAMVAGAAAYLLAAILWPRFAGRCAVGR